MTYLPGGGGEGRRSRLYIITEEQLCRFTLMAHHMNGHTPFDLADVIRSRPYNPQAEREKVLDRAIKKIKSLQYESARLQKESSTSIGDVAMNGRMLAYKESAKILEELRKGGE